MDVLQMIQDAVEAPQQALALLGLVVALAGLLYLLIDAIRYKRIPDLDVPLTKGPHLVAAAPRRINAGRCATNLGADILLSSFARPAADEAAEGQLQGAEQYTPTTQLPKDKIPCYDPSSMQFLGYAKAMSPAEVRCCCCVVQLALLHHALL
jgi:hypothetical protein